MLHSTDAHDHDHSAVRDGHVAPVTCQACGCRLEALGDRWFHFGRLGGRDARGHSAGCVEAAHLPDGTVAEFLPA